jgi:hypothetical protein
VLAILTHGIINYSEQIIGWNLFLKKDFYHVYFSQPHPFFHKKNSNAKKLSHHTHNSHQSIHQNSPPQTQPTIKIISIHSTLDKG